MENLGDFPILCYCSECRRPSEMGKDGICSHCGGLATWRVRELQRESGVIAPNGTPALARSHTQMYGFYGGSPWAGAFKHDKMDFTEKSMGDSMEEMKQESGINR